MKKVLLSILFFAIIIGGAFAGGQRDVPQMTTESSGDRYISPNGDEIQDSATISFSVVLYVKSDDGYVPEYGVLIQDESGTEMYRSVTTETSDVGWLARLFRNYTQFTLERSIAWDGKDSQGNVVSEGTYHLSVWVVDGSRQRQEIDLDDFIVDLTAPTATSTTDVTRVSPDNDGNQDSIAFTQSGSSESTWTGAIRNSSGTTVRSYRWTSSVPANFTWDGKNDAGALVPNGVYSYLLACTDAAGNALSVTVADLAVDVRDTPIQLALSSAAFSPNGDSSVDTLTVTPTIQDATGLSSWTLAIKDESGNSLRQWTGTTTAPAATVFDGRASSGTVIPDGAYSVSLSLVYANGNRPSSSEDLTIDTVAPVVSAAINNPYFSPNGDDVKDTVTLAFTLSETCTWTGSVLNAAGQTVNTATSAASALEFVWTGAGTDAATAPEGAYDFRGVFTDAAGNATVYPSEAGDARLVLDVTAPDISVRLSDTVLSPRTPGGAIAATFESNETGTWYFGIFDPERMVTYVREAQGQTISSSWDGTDALGMSAVDGVYLVTAEQIDRAGNTARAADQELSLRRGLPALRVAVENRAFSPNADGIKDQVLATATSDQPVDWTVVIRDQADAEIVRLALEGQAIDLAWDGRNANGVVQPDGPYSVEIACVNPYGNAADATERITIDTTPPEATLTVDPPVFSPNGDGFRDETSILVYVNESVTGSSQITTETGTPVFALPQTLGEDAVVWNGSTDAGETAPDGRYDVRLNLSDVAGNPAQYAPTTIRLDRRLQLVNLLVPRGFSPNRDGVRDTLPITVDAVSYTDLTAWMVSVENSEGTVVDVYDGTGTLPESITYDGAGRLARVTDGTYTAHLEAMYANGRSVVVDSDPFKVDTTPPSVTIQVASVPFVVIGAANDIEGTMFVTPSVEDEMPVQNWIMDIQNQRGSVVRSYAGQGDPTDSLSWTGSTTWTRAQENAAEFFVNMTVTDEVGNTRTLRQPVTVDVLLINQNGRLHLMVPNIIFGEYQWALNSAGRTQYDANMQTIARVASIMQRFPQFRLTLEGHAENYQVVGTPANAAEEARVQPVTERRAQTVRDALVQAGVSADRLSTAGFGGRFPIVNPRDGTVLFRNRRVEFVIDIVDLPATSVAP